LLLLLCLKKAKLSLLSLLLILSYALALKCTGFLSSCGGLTISPRPSGFGDFLTKNAGIQLNQNQ